MQKGYDRVVAVSTSLLQDVPTPTDQVPFLVVPHTHRTHRGRGAIGPGSTPPSFVLTPAAFPPVRVIPVALSLAAMSVVVQVWGEISRIIAFGCSVRFPVPVSFATLVQSSVSFIVSSVKRSVFC
ncbi:hypothetical protein GOODEAATRI_026599 [Goodea atripinnis]|uniref:Uncharacterized protein n=1 Tax=Goodea atripinnis TaxID=208336 RepID=A0ABV0P809_9TELE